MKGNFDEILEAIEFGLSMQGYVITDHGENGTLIVRKAGDWNKVCILLSEYID